MWVQRGRKLDNLLSPNTEHAQQMSSACKMATGVLETEKALLQQQIRTQGDVVRQMKKDKKAKEEVRYGS